MATGGFPEEEFACSVCLEVLQDPATLPCGHTYCLPCIQLHWDQGEAKKVYSCPQCRKTFTPRPMLARSTVLVEAMEKLKVMTGALDGPPSISAPPSLPAPCPGAPPDGDGQYPQLPVSTRLCPEHRQPLELFCPEDGLFVCRACGDRAHRDHRVVTAEVARAERQRYLAQMQEDTQRRIQEREWNLQQLPQSARAHKVAVQALQCETREVFAELARSVELAGAQVQELLAAYEMAEGSRVEGQIHRLEQDLARLRSQDEELRRLMDMKDHFCFLKNFLTLDTPIPGGEGEGEVAWANAEAVVLGVHTALWEFRNQHKELSLASLARIFRTVNMNLAETPEAPPLPLPSEHMEDPNPQPPVNEMAASSMASLNETSRTSNWTPASGVSNQNSAGETASQNSPIQYKEPKTRDELLKFRFDPTLDPNTAYRHLRLSDGDRKATLRAEPQPYPEHAGRFLFWRQVLCREPLAASPCYWEAEWTGTKVTVGVAYAGMGRTSSDESCRLGHNDESWALYWSGTGFSLWHGGRETPVKGSKARRVGVYVDQQDGVLAFYRVSHNQAELLHRVQADFSGPLYPGFRFWTGVGASVTLCQLG